MKETPMDDERIAALLDGRLDPRARDELLAQIAASDDAAAALGDVASVLRDLEEADAIPATDFRGPGNRPPVGPSEDAVEEDTDVIGGIYPPSAVPREGPLALVAASPPPRRPVRRWMGMLAAAVGLGAVGLTLYGRGDSRLADDAGAIVALLPPDARASTTTPAGWSVTRGASDALSPRARAVRVGARRVDLALAARAGEDVAPAARQLAGLLDGVTGGAPAAQIYRQMVDGVPHESLPPLLAEDWSLAKPVLVAADAEAGVWLAAARVAAAARDARFFRDRASRRAVGAIAARPDLDPAIRAAAERVRDAIAGETIADWSALGADLDAVLGALGS